MDVILIYFSLAKDRSVNRVVVTSGSAAQQNVKISCSSVKIMDL